MMATSQGLVRSRVITSQQTLPTQYYSLHLVAVCTPLVMQLTAAMTTLAVFDLYSVWAAARRQSAEFTVLCSYQVYRTAARFAG